MKGERFISYECIEQISQWVRAHCCLDLTQGVGRELLRGLFFIVEEEVRRALDKERARIRKSLSGETSPN